MGWLCQVQCNSVLSGSLHTRELAFPDNNMTPLMEVSVTSPIVNLGFQCSCINTIKRAPHWACFTTQAGSVSQYKPDLFFETSRLVVEVLQQVTWKLVGVTHNMKRLMTLLSQRLGLGYLPCLSLARAASPPSRYLPGRPHSTQTPGTCSKFH